MYSFIAPPGTAPITDALKKQEHTCPVCDNKKHTATAPEGWTPLHPVTPPLICENDGAEMEMRELG